MSWLERRNPRTPHIEWDASDPPEWLLEQADRADAIAAGMEREARRFRGIASALRDMVERRQKDGE
jgi:hypothetical protein